MTVTSHALVGTLIAAKVSNPFISVPLSLFSHFALDMLPHWDTGTNHRKKTTARLFVESSLDVVLSFAVSFFVYIMIFHGQNYLNLVLCVLASQIPDWLSAPYVIFKSKFAPTAYVAKFQMRIHKRHLTPILGIMLQIGVVLLLYIIPF